MKKILFTVALLSSMSAFSSVTFNDFTLLSLKYSFRNVIENTLAIEVVDMQYSEDQNSLNVYFDQRVCYRVNLEEVTSYDTKDLVMTKILRDTSCDKDK